MISQSRGGSPPVVDVATEPGVRDVQGVLDRITTACGWRRLLLPVMPRRFVGTWRVGDRPPAGWPQAANDGRVVSMAVTGNKRYCWTEPESAERFRRSAVRCRELAKAMNRTSPYSKRPSGARTSQLSLI